MKDEDDDSLGISTAWLVRTRRRKIIVLFILAIFIGIIVSLGTMMTTTFSCSFSEGYEGPDEISSPSVTQITATELEIRTSDDCVASLPLTTTYVGLGVLFVVSVVVWEKF